ncbi:ATP-binding protein [Candidatus Pacearchaeota archaeon]|nr:ATP-binding protein [Candidatus Pacearchaeota archaeon]
MAEIKGILQDLNPWWGGKFEIEFQDRDLYEQIQKFIPLRQIIAFTGLRRVGKTTLMLKIAEDFTKEFDAKRIIYFSFDEFREIELRELIRKYEELLENDFRKGKYLLLLDEIQKLTDWENKLKGIYDAFGKNVKIIISGSESLFIKKKSKETLAGRIFEFKIETLSFKEFLSFKKFDFKNVNLREKELKFLFNKFTLTQGFPELVEIEEKEIIRKYIRENVIERVLYRDIQKVFKIKDASKVESLFNLFLEEPGQLADVSELANELGISRQTVSNYLNCLEKSFLNG